MMKTPEGNVLMHDHAPYDAQKAHEYYLLTRKLHPRQKGSQEYTVKTASGNMEVSAPELAKERAFADKKVSQIEVRLARLKQELQNKLADTKKAQAASSKVETAAEKAAKAKTYQQTHKQELQRKAQEAAAKKKSGASTTTAAKKKTVAAPTANDLKVDIAGVRAELNTAIARQRALATAKKSG